MNKRYAAFDGTKYGDGLTFLELDSGIQYRLEGKIIHPKADIIFTCDAASWEEACTKYHEFMGWEAYVPQDS